MKDEEFEPEDARLRPFQRAALLQVMPFEAVNDLDDRLVAVVARRVDPSVLGGTAPGPAPVAASAAPKVDPTVAAIDAALASGAALSTLPAAPLAADVERSILEACSGARDPVALRAALVAEHRR